VKLSVSSSPTSSPTASTSFSTPATPASPSVASPRRGFIAALFGSRSPKPQTNENSDISEDVRKRWTSFTHPKSEATWIILGYPDAKSTKIIVVDTGTGGLPELKTKLDSKVVQFGAFRVTSTDEHSSRSKLVGFTLVSTSLAPLQRRQAMNLKDIQRDLWTGITTTIEISQASELLEDKIGIRLVGVERAAKRFDFVVVVAVAVVAVMVVIWSWW